MKLFKINNYSLKLDRNIYLVFVIVVMIAVSNAIISALTIRSSKKIVYDLSLVTSPSLEKLEEMSQLVTRSRMLVTNWVYLPSNISDKDSLRALNTVVYPQLKNSMTRLMTSWHIMESTDRMNRIFHDYEELMIYEKKITGTLIRFDDYQDPMKKFAAEELIENEINPRSNAIMIQLRQLTGSKKMEAEAMQQRMIKSYFYLLVMVLGLSVIIIVSVLMAGAYMLKKVIVPILKIREVIMQMSKGELPDFSLRFSYNALGEMSYAIRQLIDGLKRTAHFAGEIGKGQLQTPFEPLSEKDVFGSALIEMRRKLLFAAESDNARNWTNEGVAKLGNILHKNTEDLRLLCEEVITGLVTYVEAQQGAIYLVKREKGNDPYIELQGFYGLNLQLQKYQRVEMNAGLLGQAVSTNNRIYIPAISNPEYTIETGLTKTETCHVLIVPLYARGEVLGAMEIVSANELNDLKISFISQFAEPVAANIFSIQANLVTKKLLVESQKQAEELANQDQELRQINNELTTQSQLLKLSEEELKSQQDELRKMNSELEGKAVLLEEKNLTIEDARQSIAFKAEQLEKTNKYKSAFLANMSHELRTPLNSVLILAKLLADNKEKNLNEKQKEYAEVIHKSGSDLLFLINDILDLSKIESGKIELIPETLNPKDVVNDLFNLFRELANEKGISFEAKTSPDLPSFIVTDRMRLDQVLKNLLSNAFKFTPKNGKVTLLVETAKPDLIFKNRQLFAARKIISISVSDTGIGIPEDKQQLIFEAFKQADGSTSRKYGGTGLGLAISKELTHLLGGDLVLASVEGTGSTFTVHLPDQFSATPNGLKNETDEIPETAKRIKSRYKENKLADIYDDRNDISPQDLRILIIEDDLAFSKTLLNLAHSYGLKVITASQGDTGLQHAALYRPNAILLDMQLPVMDGWAILKKLKENQHLKHIPVYILSGMEKQKLGMDLGAAGYLVKPIDLREIKKVLGEVVKTSKKPPERILLVENKRKEMEFIIRYLKEHEEVTDLLTVENLQDGIRNMQMEKFDRILVNASFNGSPENAILVDTLASESKKSGTSFYLYNEKNLNPDIGFDFSFEKTDSLNQSNGAVNNREEQPNAAFNSHQQPIIPPDLKDFLKGKKVLLADDDMRNIYSLTSILETEGMHVICAYDGKEAIEKLNENTGIQLVLMDIMMPEMDGYEAIRRIRENPNWTSLPVIALTAKAMAGDRDKCLEAGASDYHSKPIQVEQLISLMKVWLYQ